jgi:hypothetical protein
MENSISHKIKLYILARYLTTNKIIEAILFKEDMIPKYIHNSFSARILRIVFYFLLSIYTILTWLLMAIIMLPQYIIRIALNKIRSR